MILSSRNVVGLGIDRHELLFVPVASTNVFGRLASELILFARMRVSNLVVINNV